MFSLSLFAVNKNVLMEIFEILQRFKHNILMKNGDVMVDAHSIIGVYSLDIQKPIELIMEEQPDQSFIEAVSKYTLPATA